MDSNSRSLKQIFADAETQRLSLQGIYDTNSSQSQDTLSAALREYQECLQMISAVSIFSPNESAEDISTSDLPYLLVNFHVAELVQRQSTPTTQARKRTLQDAREAYERFLHLLDSYDLLKSNYKKLLEEYSDAPTTFSTLSTQDMTARRNAKMANYKMEKELRTRLEYLRSQPTYADLDGDGSGGGGDEETVRAVHLAHVDYSTHMTFQGLESLNREWDVLAMAPEPTTTSVNSVAEDGRRRTEEQGDRNQYSERLDSPLRGLQGGASGPLLSAKGKPLQPFTLLGNRQEIARGVFRPGHNLPTMTIDEYLDEERRRGGIIEGGGEASGLKPEPDEDDMEKADAETMKAREWDEFTEANPRGSGNTLNRG
jgi:immunoglobulin-binding protein 1